MIQLVCRFVQPSAGFLERAQHAIALLAAQPTCERIRLARSTENWGQWTLTAEFPSFSGYRTALSPFDVRTVVIPFLSEADQSGSAVLEVVLSAVAGAITEHETVVDPDGTRR